jgi:hypothetical protein
MYMVDVSPDSSGRGAVWLKMDAIRPVIVDRMVPGSGFCAIVWDPAVILAQ